MKTLKKINLKSVSDTLVDREMKNIVGGYDGSECKNPGNTKFQCECVDSVGVYVSCCPSRENAEASGKEWCASGVANCYQV